MSLFVACQLEWIMARVHDDLKRHVGGMAGDSADAAAEENSKDNLIAFSEQND
jgi:hypothetical protein